MDIEPIRTYQPDLDRFVLGCDHLTWHEPPAVAGLDMMLVGETSPVELIREAMTVNERGFDPAAAEVEAVAAEAFRPNLIDCWAVTARWDGRAVAGGMFRPVRDGLAELVGIATLVDFRRRGFGGAVTARLTREAFACGARTVFLSTDDEDARRVYQRAGFRDIHVPA